MTEKPANSGFFQLKKQLYIVFYKKIYLYFVFFLDKSKNACYTKKNWAIRNDRKVRKQLVRHISYLLSMRNFRCFFKPQSNYILLFDGKICLYPVFFP